TCALPISTPATTSAAAPSSTTIASACVTKRRRSSMNRSSISSANAPRITTSSGASGAMSARVRTGGVIDPEIIAAESSKLARGELARQLCDGRFHQVGQRLGPHADQQHADREHAQHQPLPAVDVLELGDVGIGDLAEH